MRSFLEFYKVKSENFVSPAMNPGVMNPPPAPAAPPAAAPAAAAPNQSNNNVGSDPKKTLQDILGKRYEDFVKLLGENIKDEKFLNFLKAGLEDGVPTDDVVNFSEISIPCNQLKPTQNEIDIDKSFGFSLKKTSTEVLTSYFNGGAHEPGGKIITCGNGKFIIDGHHRWSQLYCMNPDAQINSIDMTTFNDPVQALKIAQVAIAATKGSIPIESVEGTNLIGINKETLDSYIDHNIGDDAKNAFSELKSKTENQTSLENHFQFIHNYLKKLNEFSEDPSGETTPEVMFAKDYIWKNVQQMNANNIPISGASKRDFMPQTDKAKGWDQNLASGSVNWNV